MTIRVVMAGATGWVGRAMIPAILSQPDLALAGAVSRGAAGQDAGTAAGIASVGIAVSGTLAQALEAPSDVVVDYTRPDVVKDNTLHAISRGSACGDRHVWPGLGRLCRNRRRGEG